MSELGSATRMVPRLRSTVLPRPRVMTLLSEITDFPAVVVKAGAGYGKTTALADFIRQSRCLSLWFTLRSEHQDSVHFVQTLCEVLFDASVPAQTWKPVIEAAHSPVTWLQSAVTAADLVTKWCHSETVLVFDDFHILDGTPVLLQWLDVWLRRLPAELHIVLLTRTNPAIPWLDQLASHGDVLWVRERDLAFTEPEIGVLFREGTSAPDAQTSLATHHELSHTEVRWLLLRTAGMAMVLSVLLRDWRQHGQFSRLEMLLSQSSGVPATPRSARTRPTLPVPGVPTQTTSLQSEVGRLFVENLRPEEQAFLRATSLYPTLHSEMCDFALQMTDSASLLEEMERRGHIALSDVGTYHLHPLVRDYLATALSAQERQTMLERAVTWHLQRGEEPLAIPYLFDMEQEDLLMEVLFTYIPRYLNRGQVSTVKGWLERLPRRLLESSPGLLAASGEVARHTNRFPEAVERYAAAARLAEAQKDAQVLAQIEMARARLYLDTIQPGLAAPHIREARRWVDRADRPARYAILQIEFENCINLGRIRRASRILKVLTTFQGAELPTNNSDLRLLLRSGQITEVISRLKARVSTDTSDRAAFAHREATLLLALMYAMHGDGNLAKEQAVRGQSVGYSLQSPFVSAVGLIRLGHAEHLLDPLSDAALHTYQEAINQMDEMDIPRGKSEALLGLCLAHGYRGQLALARSYADQGVELALKVQDRWMASLVRLGYGQCAVVNDAIDSAIGELGRCVKEFEQVGDAYLCSAAELWLALAQYRAGHHEFARTLASVLNRIERTGSEFLLERPTLCGVRDIQSLVPMLRAYRERGGESRLALHVLHRLGGDTVDRHPGYTLRVQTLGGFRVWRGFTEVTRKDWQREKARQLFQFFITCRGRWMHRDEICDALWTDLDAATAERDFKVALNALASVLEPDRGRGPSVFIARQGVLYGLTTEPIVELDRDVFEQRIADAENAMDDSQRRSHYAAALALYRGDYLESVRYEPWCEAEREKLRMMFVRAAIRYAELCFGEQRYDDVIQVCERVLAEEPTWEEAYGWLMRTYAAQYHRSMVATTFAQCERILERELGVRPLPETEAVYRELMERT